jgi:hypothetical protein
LKFLGEAPGAKFGADTAEVKRLLSGLLAAVERSSTEN